MLVIDTNIFLEVMLGQREQESCATFLRELRDGGRKGAVTDFTIYSIMVTLEWAGRLPELKTFLSSLSAYRGLTLHPTSLEEKLNAVELVIEGKFDLDDALQYVSARTLKSEGIVSLDRHFDGHPIPRIEPASLSTVK